MAVRPATVITLTGEAMGATVEKLHVLNVFYERALRTPGRGGLASALVRRL